MSVFILRELGLNYRGGEREGWRERQGQRGTGSEGGKERE